MTLDVEEMRTLLEAMDEGVLLFGSDVHYERANRSAEAMLKIYPSLLDSAVQLARCAVSNGQTLTDAVSFKERHFDLIALPTFGRTLVLIQDISSHRNIVELGRNFVSNASHELRTPITIIRGFAETLHDLPELPQEMVKDITEKIVRNCERMDNLVKNLLILADIEHLPYESKQIVNILPIVEGCQYHMLCAHKDAHIDLVCSHHTVDVPADPHLLELAITNLLQNAIKYSTPPVQVKISIALEKDVCHIAVEDKGIGIPQEDMQHIFERFYTVNKTRSRRLGGAGLGLSIVKTAAEKQGASIKVESKKNTGSIFTLSIPLRQ